MAKFKINVIAHQLKGKKVAKFGEVVDESELTSDSKELLSKGFIVKLSDKNLKADADAKAKADADAKAKADADAKADANAKPSDAVSKAAEKLEKKAAEKSK